MIYFPIARAIEEAPKLAGMPYLILMLCISFAARLLRELIDFSVGRGEMVPTE